MTTLIVIHGFLDRGSDYSLLIDALQSHGTVIAPDAPGHTERLGRPFRMVDWLEAIEMEVIRHDASVLIGHSAGGHVAMLTAARHADRVRGVAALETPMRVLRGFLLSDPVQSHFASYLADPVLSDVVHFPAQRDLDSFLDGFSEDAVDAPPATSGSRCWSSPS